MKKAYLSLVKSEHALKHVLLLLIRLYWGALLAMTGFGKLMNIDHTTSYFADLHLPLPLLSATLSGCAELLGGLSLILGFLTPLLMPILVINFIVAYATAHTAAFQSFFTNPSLFVSQQPFLYLLTALIVLCFGPGMFSIDYWLQKK